MPSGYKDLGDRQGGDPNILKLKEVNKVRPLDNVVAGWRQHGIEHPSDPEQFASVVCPGPRSCPLCRKPVSASGESHFPVSRRFAANVWDYDTKSVKVMVAGPQVFDELKAAATVGIDPSACDWTITKTGTGRNTEYHVIRHDAAPFTEAQVTPEVLHAVDKYEQPASTEAIFEILERFGIDYDSLTVPSYTYDQALAFVMPYTKHKGETIEQLVTGDSSYAEWLHGTKLEQGALGDPVFLALQTVMEERGLVPPLEDALAQLPEPEPETVEHRVTVNQPTADAELSPAAANMVKLIGPDGNEVMVPPTAVEHMLKAGFKHPAPPAPATAADASAPTKVIVGGKEVTLPREQALLLIDAGTATLATEEPAPEPEPEAPKLPLPDEQVEVSIAGTAVPMPYVQAAALVDAGSAEFTDPLLTAAHASAKADAAAQPDPSPAPSTESPSIPQTESTSDGGSRAVNPEKPFQCDQCDAEYKTQGGLTAHKNREHKAAAPQPSAVPASTSNGDVAQRVKDKIAQAPFARDYTQLLKIFEEATGTKNFAEMDEARLVKLEERIDAEIAKAK